MNLLGSHFNRPYSRWSRLRLVVSWIGWLMVWLFLFVPDGAWLAVLSIFLICGFRPRRMTEPTDKERLAIALALLLGVPLLVMLLSWNAAIEFFRSPIGLLTLLGIWLAEVVRDFRFYRSLPPFYTRTKATPMSPTC
jgi:hypothetical protein